MTHDLDPLLILDGASFEAAEGYVVEFKAKSIKASARRPHGLAYSLVLRPRAGGLPLVRFDNAHAVGRNRAFDHWYRTVDDPGRPYRFASTAQLLDDFWHAVKRALNERGIPNDL